MQVAGGGGGGGTTAEAEQGGAGLGVGLEGLCRGRQRWAIGQAELERLHRKGQGSGCLLRLGPRRR